jgi:D-alanyl-D-alanine carboxypeptidase/D-alanyl-D-alanine-endopeptidase (penicillin-binding protein 4)
MAFLFPSAPSQPARPARPVRLLPLLLATGLALPAAALAPAAHARDGMAAAGSHPALPANTGAAPLSAVSLPALPPPSGAPVLQSQVSCPSLQQRLLSLLAGETSVWSVTVADGNGRLLADVNGTRPRVPASNQKLLSTAFALDRLGPDFRLSTQLWRLPDGRFRLVGSGDPDLALPQLQRFARLALQSGGGPAAPAGPVRLELAEEAAGNWWPQGWHWADRSAAYGAPVTRLAITSNVINEAVMNPPSRLRTLLQKTMASAGGQAELVMVPAGSPLGSDAVLIHEEPSIDMHGLLSLANTESHNFTAEVLLRSAAGTWDLPEAARQETLWLSRQGLPMEGVRIYDGSGLDRSNRLTSRFLAALLLRMNQHPYARNYVASMSVAGRRGTLRNLYRGTSLDGNLFAKTGTLTGVRAITGVLQTSDGVRFVSAISNGAGAPNQTIGAVLRQVQSVGSCGAAGGGDSLGSLR